MLPEFSNDTTFEIDAHICHHDIGYDMIIGRETLTKLGVSLNFEKGEILMNDVIIDMKPPDYFNNKEQLLSTVLEVSEPEACVHLSNRAFKILDAKYDKFMCHPETHKLNENNEVLTPVTSPFNKSCSKK